MYNNTIHEIWKDIEGYEGIYQVSSLGRVKSMERVRSDGKRLRGRVLKQGVWGSGYYAVTLRKNGRYEKFYVHRLVAKAFLVTKKDGYVVDLLNGDKFNNSLNNLEWVSHSENARRGWSQKNNRERRNIAVLNGKRRAKPVIKLNMAGEKMKEFNSLAEAGKTMGIFPNGISLCCNGKRKTAGGYRWEFKL